MRLATGYPCTAVACNHLIIGVMDATMLAIFCDVMIYVRHRSHDSKGHVIAF